MIEDAIAAATAEDEADEEAEGESDSEGGIGGRRTSRAPEDDDGS